VLEALAGLLENDGFPHAALESEQFAWGYPWLTEEEAYAVLGVACDALKELGRSLFLIAGTTETDTPRGAHRRHRRRRDHRRVPYRRARDDRWARRRARAAGVAWA